MFRFATVVQRLGLVLALLLAFGPLASAQQAPLVGVEPIGAALDQIEGTARRGGVGIRLLYDLQQTLVPLRDELRVKLAELEPRLADVETRLRGLGPAPASGAPPENPAIAAERARLTQLRGELDAAVRQVRLLQVRADQLTQFISERRRAAYAETLFERSPSVLDPTFWRDVAAAIPGTVALIYPMYRDAWVHASKVGPGRLVIALVLLAILAAGMSALSSVWRQRLGPRAGGEPRFSPATASILTFIRTGFAMPLLVAIAAELLDQLGVLSKPLVEIAGELVAGIFFASLGRATALAIFAPDEPRRRILNIDDASARSFSSHLVWGSRALGLLVFMLGVQKTVGVPQIVSTAVSMVFSLLIFVLLVHLLFQTRPSEADFGVAQRRPTLWVRPFAWAAVVAITIALVAGYTGLAAFVAGRVIFTVILLGALYLLLHAADWLIGVTMSPESPRSRGIAANLGLDPRRLGLIGIVLSGAMRVLFALLAIALMIGPWEIAAADFLETVRVAVFGIKIGDIRISFGAVFGALAVFVIVLVLTRLVQRWLERRLLPNTRIEPSLQLSIVTVFGYIGFILALVAALSEIGIDPQKIALVAGALSVGIGFGLQSIVSNFVSGLILLAERPIRVGDQIVVRNEEGFVRRISVRATEIETFDKASVIVPNSELITGVVKNWTHADTLGRLNIKVSVSYDCDADKVIDTLKSCVAAHSGVLKHPPPAVLLTEFGTSALLFELFCIVPNLAERGRVKSEIHVAILRAFREAGIDMTPPQDVRLIGGGAGPI